MNVEMMWNVHILGDFGISPSVSKPAFYNFMRENFILKQQNETSQNTKTFLWLIERMFCPESVMQIGLYPIGFLIFQNKIYLEYNFRIYAEFSDIIARLMIMSLLYLMWQKFNSLN